MKSFVRNIWLCLFLLTLWGVPFSMGQAVSIAPSVSVNSKLVVLDVVVADRAGNPVPGLQMKDFTVLEDGKPQKIRSLESVQKGEQLHEATAAKPQQRGAQAESSRTIFVLDELNTPFDEKAFCVENLRRYWREQPKQLASSSMLVTANFSGLKKLADFTHDRDALLHALDQRGPALPAATAGMDLVAQTVAILRQIAMLAQGERTHVNVVWIGRAFPSIDPINFTNEDGLAFRRSMEETVHLLMAAHVTLYQVNPVTVDDRIAASNANGVSGAGSGSVVNTGAIDLLDGAFGFNVFVASTGGEMFYGSNDLAHFIAQSVAHGTSFYTLSYVPSSDFTSTTDHTIRVLTHDPGLHVYARNALGASSPSAAPPRLKDIGVDLKLAATDGMAYSAVDAAILSATRQGDDLAVRFRVEDRSLSWRMGAGGKENSSILILLVTLGRNRQILSSVTRKLELSVKDPSAISAGALVTTETLPFDRRSNSIRLILRDSNGKIGTSDLDAASFSSTPASRP